MIKKIKNLKERILLILLIVFLNACDSEKNENKTLSVSPTSLTFLYSNNSSNNITITSNTSWTISGVPAWINISSTSGSNNGIVTLTTSSENTDSLSRTSILTISGTGVNTTYTVNITQFENVSFSYFTSDDYFFVRVKGGTFNMGCPPEQVNICYSDESPAHSVTLSNFSIGKYEVTKAQWVSVMGSNPTSLTNSNDCPVEQVSWDDVQTFLTTLNNKTGKNYRLPTEAEWEYAARGGKKSAGDRYSGNGNLGSVAWYRSNSGASTHNIGTKIANELGIYDMSGNVREWCSDWFGSYTSASLTNPTGPSTGSYKVIRGGSWLDDDYELRVYNRFHNDPKTRYNTIGFRLVLP